MEEREQKNQVFGMSDVIRQAQSDQMRTQMGAGLPVNTIPLPSKGAVYPVGTPLHKLTEVQLKAMTVQEENILTSKALLKKGTVITELIRSCVLNRDINVGDMLSGDRNTLMVAIRSEGYGNEYEVEVKCPACGESAQQTFDLNSFELKYLDIEPTAEGKNEFPFTLPSGTAVTFRFLTGKDEEDIIAIQDSRKKLVKAGQSPIDDSLQLQIQYALVSVGGDVSKNAISGFVRTMRARDSRAFRTYIADHQPGIDMSQSVECPHCQHTEEEVSMPIGVGFFWPER